MQLLEAVELSAMREAEIPLPAWCPERLRRVALKFRRGTSTGPDWLRVRHVADLSQGALQALCKIFERIEGVARWPSQLRSVIEVALPKKTGGARLIGVAPSIYRIWARMRYLDVRIILEKRLERPTLAAAPGRGASRTALEAAFATEAAIARGWVAASTAVDMKQFYEHIEVSEFVAAAQEVGIPRQLVLLAAHFYLGPRRLRVGGAFSRPIPPGRGIVAGCTWCTVLIRVLCLKPLDALTKQLRQWEGTWDVVFVFRLYVDDGMISTMGPRHIVEMLHSWASKFLVEWVQGMLNKIVSRAKLQCTASDAGLRKALRCSLGPVGFKVTKDIDLLGVDATAGGRFQRRNQMSKRLRRAWQRRGRLTWWRNRGGDLPHVLKGGIEPSVTHGGEVTGIPPHVQRSLRRLFGISNRVQCKGTSLTSKLALAGPHFEDADILITHLAPPLRSLLCLLWTGLSIVFLSLLRGAKRAAR